MQFKLINKMEMHMKENHFIFCGKFSDFTVQRSSFNALHTLVHFETLLSQFPYLIFFLKFYFLREFGTHTLALMLFSSSTMSSLSSSLALGKIAFGYRTHVHCTIDLDEVNFYCAIRSFNSVRLPW